MPTPLPSSVLRNALMIRADFSADVTGENPAAATGTRIRTLSAQLLVNGLTIEGMLGACVQT